MKIEELSIGDFLFFTDGDCAVRVEEIYNDAQLLISDGDSISEPVHLTHLHPIPLTPEILEKNGYKVCSVRRQFEDRIWDSVAIRKYHTEDYYHLFIYGLRIGIKLCDVHQLQHALRLAGIEKEIEV